MSFWGESEGTPRNAVSPDIYSEDFSAAVDYLGAQTFVDRERIGRNRQRAQSTPVFAVGPNAQKVQDLQRLPWYQQSEESNGHSTT